LLGGLEAFDGKHVVSLTLLARMNNKGSASACTNVLRTFPNLELLVLSGIALAVPNVSAPQKHVRLGDIVVSDRAGIIDLDHVVRSESGSQSRSILPPPSAELTRALGELEVLAFEGRLPWMSKIQAITDTLPAFARPSEAEDVLLDESKNVIAPPQDDERVAGMPRVFRGAIGSGDALIRDAGYRDEMRDKYGLLAIEMEGAGVAECAWQFGRYYMVVRGTCDYGVPKNDRWHKYAAAVAAAYTAELLGRVTVGHG
jgi:nucleoside phosphorylase